jgi:hypothetical protein
VPTSQPRGAVRRPLSTSSAAVSGLGERLADKGRGAYGLVEAAARGDAGDIAAAAYRELAKMGMEAFAERARRELWATGAHVPRALARSEPGSHEVMFTRPAELARTLVEAAHD